jgi:hypothetical protein
MLLDCDMPKPRLYHRWCLSVDEAKTLQLSPLFRSAFAMSPVAFLPFNDARHCPLGYSLLLSHKSQIRLRERIPANQLSLVFRKGQQLHSVGRSEDFAARHRFGVY